jgi:hypothetical protein|tara:strand:- start:593 stop:853 length:261 start_codon:yes stop_codon:yes gene_type:complete
MIQQQSFRFYDKDPEQLTLYVTQEQPQPDYSNYLTSINGGGLCFSNDTYATSMKYTVNLNNVVVEDDEKPSLVKRILLKQLGIKYK